MTKQSGRIKHQFQPTVLSQDGERGGSAGCGADHPLPMGEGAGSGQERDRRGALRRAQVHYPPDTKGLMAPRSVDSYTIPLSTSPIPKP